jgi:tagatose-6-phosphate ketose/aldose isomerase
MPATPTEKLEFLGIPADELTASGALWTAREIEQQPQMLQRTHMLSSGLHAELQKFVSPVCKNPLARVILTGAGWRARRARGCDSDD